MAPANVMIDVERGGRHSERAGRGEPWRRVEAAVVDILGQEHISLTVRDIEKTAKWYEQVLGLTRQSSNTDEVQGWKKVRMTHLPSGMRLNFTEHFANSGAAFDERRTGLDHLAFRVASRQEMEAWVAHFDRLGVEHSPIKEGRNGYILTFRDPDNIQLELSAVASAA